MLKEKVEDYSFSDKMTVDELVSQMDKAWGFTAGKLAVGLRILEKMIEDRKCVKFISFTGNLVATGTRGALKELVKRKLVDVVVTTCGTVDHDLARSWRDYYKGSFLMSDAKLRQQNINRLGNVLVPNDSYGVVIERKIQSLLQDLCNETSILYWAARNDIPVYVPGMTDGAVGYQIWLFSQDHDFRLNMLKDSGELSEIVFNARKTGALLVGGGISKHHTLWWNQFKDGLDYAIYVSTADELDGSLSGARPREAVSWGKISEKAKKVMIEGDASVILPIMVSVLITRIGKTRTRR